MVTVALIGPDGAGKSTIVRAAAARLTVPVRTVYMGVNLEVSSLMLPTTRLALMLKRRRGGRSDMVGVNESGSSSSSRSSTLRSAVRTANWIAEETFRHAVARWHERRGRVVLMDRLFLADYYATDVLSTDARRPIASRVHRLFLERVYPRPDLVILLDAPAALLHSRKPETDVDYLERRRSEYRQLRGAVPRFEIVDVDRPLEQVVSDVVRLIEEAYRAPSRRRGLQAVNDS